MANRIRDPGREVFWRRTLTAFGKSGLSVRAFCRREKLPETAFYFWRRTIHQRGLAPRSPKQRRRAKPPAFVPLVLGSIPSAADITLELRGGRSLRLSESFPVDRLAGLVLALEAAENQP
jgi:transposase-like protein